MDVGGPTNLEGIQEDYWGGWVILFHAHLYWHGGSWNLPLHQYLLWDLRMDWPLWGSAPVVGMASAFLAFPCSHPNTERVAASDGGTLVHRMKLAAVNMC